MPICTRCKEEKRSSEFPKNKSKKKGISSACLACHREMARDWYQRNKKKKKRDSRERSKTRRDVARDYVLSRLTECADCGETNKVVLEFDHVTGVKIAGISYMARNGFSVEDIAMEMLKCEIVCSNCHRIRTAKRNKRHWAHRKEYRHLLEKDIQWAQSSISRLEQG